MKVQKRILALMTAILLLLPLVGCFSGKESAITAESAEDSTESSVIIPAEDDPSDIDLSEIDPSEIDPEEDEFFDDEDPAPADPDEENASELFDSFDAGTFDGKAVAIELGDIRITADEVRDVFGQYFDDLDEDDETNREDLSRLMRITEERLIAYYMPEWKAKELGITLSEELEEEFVDEAESEVDMDRDAMLCLYGDPEGDAEDASELTEKQYAQALERINAMCAEQFGAGYTFDDYLALQYRNNLTSKRAEALNDLLEEYCVDNTSIDQAVIDDWYEKTLAEQTELFPDDAEQYTACVNGYDYADYRVCLYTPKKSARIQVIFIPTTESDTDWLEGNVFWLEQLEEEYNDLKQSGEDDELLAELEAEIAEQKKENGPIEARLAAGEEATANKAYADLVAGMPFEEAMAAYENYDDEESGHFERVILLDGSEPVFPMFVEIAEKLTPGTFSKPIRVDGFDQYCIVRLVERIPEGPVDRASIENDLRTAIAEESCETQMDAWVEDAAAVAVYHRETYAMLIAEYLD